MGRLCVSAKWKTRLSEKARTSLRPSTLDSSTGPKAVIVARTGMPGPLPPNA